MESFSGSARDVASYYAKRAATQQGGLLNGIDPTTVNTSDPLRLTIIQIAIILVTSQLLGVGLKRIRQPKVIAEILAGILLGPTVMGRVPHFTQHIFPTASIPFLSLIANLGLVLFLFIVGLEIDVSTIKRNTRNSAIIAICAMVLPFGIGTAMSHAIYPHFIPDTVKYNYFLLFCGVSYSITAFPVLARILTELKLLDTTVGVCVLSAGVANDIVGWTLLALAVALVNAVSGLTALWVILATAGWAIFILVPFSMALGWFARRTGSTEGNGPSFMFMTLTLMSVLASAFFTDAIGVHAIFGAFLVGIAVPRSGGLAIALVEKLEDFVTIIFLPLYFTLSGLSTNLGLLNTGKAWGFTFALIFADWGGKFTGATIGARIAGFKLREAATVGTLMSCKGLVELVVLNIGLQAHILTPQVFAMFVLDALFLTFCTTPMVLVYYPAHLRVKVSAIPHKDGLEGGANNGYPALTKNGGEGDELRCRTRLTVILDKFEHLPGMMSLTQLLWPGPVSVSEKTLATGSSTQSLVKKDGSSEAPASGAICLNALRLIELTDRSSTLMKSSRSEMLAMSDHLLRVFKTHGELNGAHVSTELAVSTLDNFGTTAGEFAQDHGSDMILLGWTPLFPTTADGDVKTSKSTENSTSSHVIRGVFKAASVDVGLFIDQRSLGDSANEGLTFGHRHVFLPFFGGADDRAALQFVVQLCGNEKITATVVKVVKTDDSTSGDADSAHEINEKEKAQQTIMSIQSLPTGPDTIYGNYNTTHQLQSSLADDILWEKCISPSAKSPDAGALSRIKFDTVSSSNLLTTAMHHVPHHRRDSGSLLVVVGRSRRMATESFHAEMKTILEKDKHGASHGSTTSFHIGSGLGRGELRKTIGDPGMAALILLAQARVKADFLVIQAGTSATE